MIKKILMKKIMWIFLIICVVVYRSTSALGMAGYSKYVFDSIAGNNVSILKVSLIGLLIVLWGASSLFLQNLVIDLFIKKINFEARIFFMRSLLKHPVRKLSDIGEGKLLTNYSQDISSIGSFIQNGIDVLRIPFEMVIASIYLIYTNWALGIIVLVLLPPITLIGNYIGKNMAQITGKYLKKSDILFKIINNAIKCMTMIKAYSIETMIEKDFTENSKANYMLEKKQAKYSSFFSGLMDLFMGLPFIVIYILSSIFNNKQTLTVGTIIMFLQLLNKITVPFIRFNQILIQYKQMKISVERLNEVLDIDIEDKDNTIILENGISSIQFNKVNFKYKEKNILDNFSLNIDACKHYGIIGENGSGKSTFIKLLLHLYTPDDGKIVLNQYDYNSLSIKGIRESKKLVYVEDDPCILFEDLDRNIVLNNIKDEKYFKEILNKVGLSNVYREISDKSAEEVSNGQKQRIALARGLYNLRDNSILVLDEPFSALDSKIINELEDTILEYKRKKNLTIFEITHNLNNMERFDHIYFFEDGKVLMEGKHEELMNIPKYKQYVSNYNKKSNNA